MLVESRPVSLLTPGSNAELGSTLCPQTRPRFFALLLALPLPVPSPPTSQRTVLRTGPSVERVAVLRCVDDPHRTGGAESEGTLPGVLWLAARVAVRTGPCVNHGNVLSFEELPRCKQASGHPGEWDTQLARLRFGEHDCVAAVASRSEFGCAFAESCRATEQPLCRIAKRRFFTNLQVRQLVRAWHGRSCAIGDHR